MENRNKKNTVVENDKPLMGPCNTIKKKLEICMKNSDDNIIYCQELRNNYENCLEEHFKHVKNIE